MLDLHVPFGHSGSKFLFFFHSQSFLSSSIATVEISKRSNQPANSLKTVFRQAKIRKLQ